MTLKELQEKRDKLVADARAALAEIRSNTDESRAAELEQRHDDIMAEFDKLEADIAREERVAAAERALEQRSQQQRSQRRPGANGTSEGADAGAGGNNEPLSYRSVFLKFLAQGADPSMLEPEERQVLARGFDDNRELRVQTAGTTTAGGYTVPTELYNQIIISMAATGPMLDGGITFELNTGSGNPIKLPTIDDTSKSAGLHTEGAALTDDNSEDVTVGQKSLDAYVYDTEFVRVSMELLADSAFNVEALLGILLGERMGRKGNSILTTGTGSSQPNGIVTASSLGVTAAAVAAITFDELIDLEHSVDPAYRSAPSARYMLADGTLKAVRKLKDGNGQYIWQAGNVRDGVPAQLNGRPYSINQAMAALATGNKTVIFGDFKKYFVRKVGAPMVGVLRERFWPDLGMAGLFRLDGELSDAAAVKHLIQA